MPSFNVVLTTFLWDPDYAPPDALGLKGYNVYNAAVALQGSEIPVSIAHMTRKNKFPHNTLARVVGHAHFYKTTLLIVATRITAAAIDPMPSVLPMNNFRLPRFSYSGFISSPPQRHPYNSSCLAFDVTIVRHDVWPLAPLVISSCINRDINRINIQAPYTIGTAVIVSGVICGWAMSNRPVVDVHTLQFNYQGTPPALFVTDVRNPFERADFGPDGFAVFNALFEPPPYNGPTILSRHAPPTRITRRYSPVADPRLSRSRHAGAGASSSPSTDGPQDVTGDDTVVCDRTDARDASTVGDGPVLSDDSSGLAPTAGSGNLAAVADEGAVECRGDAAASLLKLSRAMSVDLEDSAVARGSAAPRDLPSVQSVRDDAVQEAPPMTRAPALKKRKALPRVILRLSSASVDAH